MSDFAKLQDAFTARHKAALAEIREDQEAMNAMGRKIANKLEALAAIVPPVLPSGSSESNVIQRERDQN